MSNENRRVLRLVGGLGLIALGLIALVLMALQVNIWSLGWPFIFIIPGLLFFAGMVAGGRNSGGLAIPGSIITMLGITFFLQNTLNQWQSWAYAWTLIWPIAIGLGLVIQGAWSRLPGKVSAGKGLVRLGMIMLAIGIVFFELIIGIGGRGIFGSALSRYALPVLVIAGGVYLIVRAGLGVGGNVRQSPPHPED